MGQGRRFNMALTQVQDSKWFDYISVAADIVDNKIAGASKVGGIIYLVDSQVYKIIKNDLTLADFKQPVVV